MPQVYSEKLKVNAKLNLPDKTAGLGEGRRKRNKYQRLWASENRLKVNTYTKNWKLEHPWFQHYQSAASRVKYPSHHYYKKHLKFTMDPNDFKFLWFRDKAHKMKNPSIDRIDNKEGYILKNCQFVELSFNLAKRWDEWRKEKINV